MVEAASATSSNPPARVPASTIREIRRFHAWDIPTMAIAFKVSERTVFRWERSGLDPEALQPDPDAHPNSGPDWRRKLLFFMLDRLNGASVTDTRKQQGESP